MLSHDKFSGHNPEPVEAQATPEPEPFAMQSVPTSITHVVDTREIPAPSGGAHTLTLGSQTVAELLLPNDPKRRKAVVLAVDNDVYLATSLEEAQSVSGTTNGTSGFYLPAGIAVPVDSTSAVWAAPTTTATLSRVSVLIGRD